MSELNSFTYYDPETQESHALDLRGGPHRRSRETRGVWFYGDRAWKIFPNMNQWKRVCKDYNAATDHRLATPSFKLYRGTITDCRSRAKEGFALAATYITSPARFFALKDGTGTLMQLIAPITNDDILSRIEVALTAAIDMGLQDPQGFVNQYDPDQPIVFIDLHTRNNAARALQDIYKHVRARRATLLQQGGQ